MFKDMNVLIGPSRHAVELEKLWLWWDELCIAATGPYTYVVTSSGAYG